MAMAMAMAMDTTDADTIANGHADPDFSTDNGFQNLLLETVKGCEQRGEPLLLWTMEVTRCIGAAGLGFPSSDLGILLVSLLTDPDNLRRPSLWKFLDQALSSSLVSRIHVLALLTSRVIPKRHTQPLSYRLYLELLRKYGLVFDVIGEESCGKILKSIDLALKLFQTYQTQVVDLGHAMVLCLFSMVMALVDSTLSDLGLDVTSSNGTSELIKCDNSENMDIDFQGNGSPHLNGNCENIRRLNWQIALDVLGQITENKKAIILLRLVHLNMPETFNGLIQKMTFLESHKLISLKLESTKQLFVRASTNIQRILNFEYEVNKRQIAGMLTGRQSCFPTPSCYSGSGMFACWVPFDICMENAMDGRQFSVTSSIDVFAETIKTLQVFNCASWQETFLALWLSSLRLVQRERDPLEGPIPHLESRLCILLSITPLAIALVLKDDVVQCCQESDHTSRKNGLVSSLQILGQYTALLCPPTSVVNAANSAASKATNFLNTQSVKDDKGDSHTDTSLAAVGDMRHLIVEACIARKLLDTSAYFWPGYISESVTSLPIHLSLEISPWLKFMGGSPLTGPLVNELMDVPASSLEEIEKLHHVALNGSLEEKSAAAKILCGASLSSGWNIQEHVVRLLVKLLSPHIPPNFTGAKSHLVDHMPVLSAILFGVSSVDTVHILSLHGMMPEVAASLTPICETYGSLVPPKSSSQKTCLSNTSSIYMIFSSAFLLLLRLWKFYQPLLEQCIPGRGTIGGELTLEYLLILCNRRIQSDNSVTAGEKVGLDTIRHLDSYPKLRDWYCQNRSFVASTVCGLSAGNSVDKVANEILSALYSKMTRTGTVSGDTSACSDGGSNGSLATSEEEVCKMPVLPAWDILEAIPFVLEAVLSACAHGKLSSRDLTTGLRDIVDFLPASLAAIISYFSAEITRGIWKPVDMNGTDWPSPEGSLASVDAEIKEILAAVGVIVPCCSFGGSLPAKLPLPMAALVSLTITFKLDKSLEYILAVTGPAMEKCASACAWPSMPIISSLWVQKVRRWHDFIVVSCSRSVFRKNKEPVVQLLRSCFTAFLGSYKSSQSGVNSLLGTYISSPGLCPRVSPGFLYLRTCRTIHNVQYINNVIINLVVEFSQSFASKWTKKGAPRLKSTEASFAIAVSKAREAAMLGSTFLCISGGVQLVQELYKDSILTWVLSSRDCESEDGTTGSRVIEGYAMACLMVFSGASIWGVMERAPCWSMSSRRLKFVAGHMDFVAGVVDGNVGTGCDLITWRSYVSCLADLMVRFAPFWVQELELDTLVKLAKGLIRWGRSDLAISLLEKGGTKAMGSVAELVAQFFE